MRVEVDMTDRSSGSRGDGTLEISGDSVEGGVAVASVFPKPMGPSVSADISTDSSRPDGAVPGDKADAGQGAASVTKRETVQSLWGELDKTRPIYRPPSGDDLTLVKRMRRLADNPPRPTRKPTETEQEYNDRSAQWRKHPDTVNLFRGQAPHGIIAKGYERWNEVLAEMRKLAPSDQPFDEFLIDYVISLNTKQREKNPGPNGIEIKPDPQNPFAEWSTPQTMWENTSAVIEAIFPNLESILTERGLIVNVTPTPEPKTNRALMTIRRKGDAYKPDITIKALTPYSDDTTDKIRAGNVCDIQMRVPKIEDGRKVMYLVFISRGLKPRQVPGTLSVDYTKLESDIRVSKIPTVTVRRVPAGTDSEHIQDEELLNSQAALGMLRTILPDVFTKEAYEQVQMKIRTDS